MKSDNLKVVLFVLVLLAVGIGFHFYNQFNDKRLAEAIEFMSEDQWISAKGYLALATAIRNDKPTEALKFSEDLMSMEVKGFTNNGNNLEGLTKYEVSTIKQIREYWENKCNRECLGSISQILNNEKFR